MSADAATASGGAPASAHHPRLAIAGVLLLFLVTRLPLMAAREPFFDELYTVWISQHTLAQQWELLASDSGPPLYYAIVRLLERTAGATVTSARLLSLALGALALLLCIRKRELAAAALLAAFPPHVYYSTEARAYTLVALLLGVATVALDRFSRDGSRRALLTGALALATAAYGHSYAVLALPLPLLAGLLRREVAAGLLGSLGAGLLFLPGLRLALSQPRDAIAWMEEASLPDRLALVLGAGGQLGFAASYPALFFPPPPLAARLVSLLTVAALALWGLVRTKETRFVAAATLLPVVAACGAALAGRTVYYPVRFECALAVPFALWIGRSLGPLSRSLRLAAMSALLSLGVVVAGAGAADHARRPADPYRAIAQIVRRHHDPRVPVVASSYTYLELFGQRDARWAPELLAFPAELAGHPGWSAPASPALLQAEARKLPADFLWVGLAGSAELRALASARRLGVVQVALPALAARAIDGPPGLVTDGTSPLR